MTFIVIARDILPGHGTHHYMGSGMWSSEYSDAKVYGSTTEALDDIKGSTFSHLAEIHEVPDAPEEQQN